MTGSPQAKSFNQPKHLSFSKDTISDMDGIVDTWFLIDNNYLVPVLVLSYIAFSYKLGPKLMENRKALEIKGLIIGHNFLQILFNGSLIYYVISTPNFISHVITNSCSPTEKSSPSYYTLCVAAWFFFMSKVYDLLDTVFFVLRKKNSHVNYLHVYHHVIMLLSTWAYMKYLRDEQGVFIGLFNCAVHVVMYTYYFLSAMGPSVQKYLGWKKSVTKFQLLQFGIVCIYAIVLILSKCAQSQVLVSYCFLQAFIFGVLFARFYRRRYRSKEE